MSKFAADVVSVRMRGKKCGRQAGEYKLRQNFLISLSLLESGENLEPNTTIEVGLPLDWGS